MKWRFWLIMMKLQKMMTMVMTAMMKLLLDVIREVRLDRAEDGSLGLSIKVLLTQHCHCHCNCHLLTQFHRVFSSSPYGWQYTFCENWFALIVSGFGLLREVANTTCRSLCQGWPVTLPPQGANSADTNTNSSTKTADTNPNINTNYHVGIKSD